MERLWNAQWIADARFTGLKPVNVFHRESEASSYKPDPALANSHLLFRRTFDLPACRHATLYISADDYYKLYVNGQFVDQGPAPGNPAHYYYNAIDVTKYLREGGNVIAVHVYYQGEINRVWVSGDARCGLIAELVADGQSVLGTDEQWKTTPHSGYSAMALIGYNTQYTERYDSSSPQENFEQPDYDDSAWAFASARAHVDYRLFAQPIRQLDIYRVRPVEIRREGRIIWMDFGRCYAGYFEAKARGPRGSEIAVRTGLELLEDGRVRYRLRTLYPYDERWALSGGPCDTLRQYDYKPFRYIELELPPDCELDESSLCGIVRHYPYEEKLRVDTPDERLQKVFRLCADTLKYGVQDKYMDSLDREKGQYLGDEAFASYAHMLLTGDIALPRKFLRDAAETAVITKSLMSESVCSFAQEIADYSLEFAGNVYRHYLYTKDAGFLCEMYPTIMGILEYFEQYERPDGLLENVKEKWNLVDWPANMRDDYDFPLPQPAQRGHDGQPLTDDGAHNVLNGHYIGMLDDIDRIRAALGMDPLGKRERVAASFVRAFYDPGKGLFRDSERSNHISEHANILPLAFNIGLDERTKANILNLIREKRWTCNVYLGVYLLYGLMRHHETELLHDLLVDENAWLRMLSEGATATFEAWYKDQKWNTSLFHLAGVIPIIALAGHW